VRKGDGGMRVSGSNICMAYEVYVRMHCCGGGEFQRAFCRLGSGTLVYRLLNVTRIIHVSSYSIQGQELRATAKDFG